MDSSSLCFFWWFSVLIVIVQAKSSETSSLYQSRPMDSSSHGFASRGILKLSDGSGMPARSKDWSVQWIKKPFFRSTFQKRALNLNRFYNQYKRGAKHAIALYQAMIEAHERRLLENPNAVLEKRKNPHSDVLLMVEDRKVASIARRIVSNFIGDCVAVIIGEVFRKSGEAAGEVARLVVSQGADFVLSRSSAAVESISKRLSRSKSVERYQKL